MIGIIVSKRFNASIAEGSIPEVLKMTRVIPIFKAGLREIINNYRPISTLGFLSEMLKMLKFSRLNNFLQSRKILMKSLYVFRENSNTENAILEFMDYSYDSTQFLNVCLLSMSTRLSPLTQFTII